MLPKPMRRREFIAGLARATAWPIAARAQQPNRMRRIGVLLNLRPDHAEALARNRFAGGDADRIRGLAAELVALAPDVVIAAGGFGVGPLRRATHAIPICS